jgi:hypothetical protein
MITKWGFGPMVARLTSRRNPFHVLSSRAGFVGPLQAHIKDVAVISVRCREPPLMAQAV